MSNVEPAVGRQDEIIRLPNFDLGEAQRAAGKDGLDYLLDELEARGIDPTRPFTCEIDRTLGLVSASQPRL
jgi:hypothetical protein